LAGQTDRDQTLCARGLQGGDHVGGAAGRGNADQHIAASAEGFYLSREDAVEADETFGRDRDEVVE
jgi:hypothetical protein